MIYASRLTRAGMEINRGRWRKIKIKIKREGDRKSKKVKKLLVNRER